MAEVLQNQARDAGITIELVQAPSDGYWGDVWMKEPFFATGWSQRPTDQILNEAYRSTAAWNETAWNSAEFDAGLNAARGELDFDKRKALYGDLQKELWENGGSFIPVHLNTVRAFSSKLSGIQPVEDFSIRYEDVTKAGSDS